MIVELPNGTKVEFADKRERDPYQSEVAQLSYVTIDGMKFCAAMDDADGELVIAELLARTEK